MLPFLVCSDTVLWKRENSQCSVRPIMGEGRGLRKDTM